MCRSSALATAILVLLTNSTQARSTAEEATCNFEDACHNGHDRSAASSSLLQVFRSETKSKFWPFTEDSPPAAPAAGSATQEQATQAVAVGSSTQEQAPSEAAADSHSTQLQALPEALPEASTVVSLEQKQAPPEAAAVSSSSQKEAPATCLYPSHGKCWYLSEIGDTCLATCAKHGRNFSYAIADIDQPLIPKLVGHEPVAKQQPWAPLECYVPSEDRFHTANGNSAKHVNETEASTWHHESCKLACPCQGERTQCSWKQPAACVPEFEWRGVRYSGCASIDSLHERPWCQHHDQHLEGGSRGDAGGLSRPQDWSYCSESCDSESPPISAEPGETKAEDDELCSWHQKPECSKSFEYKGTDYNACATIDNPTPWCSLDRIHKGFWSACERVCRSVVTSAPTMPSVVTPAKDPCAGPDSSDAIEATVTIDEEGYQIVASTNSSLSMKRFICRTVEKIKCTVVDLPSLMAFVPYEMVSQKTFAHLESELTVLCHARDAWVVPKMKSSTPPTTTSTPAPTVPPKSSTPPTTTSAPAPTVPPAKDPCAINQNDKDLAGDNAALDEDGFKIAVAAGTSNNMKRFICRVVAKIECKVDDLAALMTFVPYEMASRDTYAHLESELTVLCHARGSWVVPQTVPLPTGTAEPDAQPTRTLAPSNPVNQTADPCAVDPNVNEGLGAVATLDEVGYKLTASTENPISMMRFVCRTVTKIGCRVTTLWGLKAFAPDHSGFVSHESYEHLESELITLCHAGGQWVQTLHPEAGYTLPPP